MKTAVHLTAGPLALSLLSSIALADIRISEWMYSGSGGEFIELVNVGSQPIDMTGWSYDDDNRIPGYFDLSAFGVIMPCEVVIFTEDPAEVFRAAWGLGPEVKIIGDLGKPNANTLGRNDAINLWDAKGNLIDQLIFGDQDFPGSIRAQNASGWTNAAGIGANNPFAWQLSVAGDAQGSYNSTLGALGSPGTFTMIGKPKGTLPVIAITEYMYTGPGGEFMEFTNLSDSPIDMTGWLFDDNNFGKGNIGPFNLSAFGVVQPGESVILTEANADDFRAAWGLGAEVKIIGNLGFANGHNIGRNDEINIYNAEGELVDRLTYGDQNFPGTIRTQNISGWTMPKNLGQNNVYGWFFAAEGDALNSWLSMNGDRGNPGVYLDLNCVPQVIGDLNGDSVVDVLDLLILLGAWGNNPGHPADLNGDGVVDVLDLLILLGNWG